MFIAEHEAIITAARREKQPLSSSAAEPAQRIWFMPQPGMPSVQQFWTLQLLLFIAAQSTSKKMLAQQLSMPAYRMEQAATYGHAYSIARWSENQFLTYLRTAIEEFEEITPQPDSEAAGFKLRGRELVADDSGTEPIRLSKAEAAFLRMLAECCFSAVSYDAFEKANISPADTKKRLLHKLKGHHIEVHIASSNGAYVLMTPITITT